MAEISFFDRVATHRAHVPDVLSCIANLSNDEVFTPPDVVNKMLDLLPQELFADPKTTFLDPATKTGVFLREIAKRCLDAQLPGYKERSMEITEKKRLGVPLDEYDNAFEKQLQEKIDHIFHNQLYGIGITELTSLLARRGVYCSKYPNGTYSITHFDDAEGNIRFRRTEHVWDTEKAMTLNGKKLGKCIYCGASREQYDRGDVLESHAYEFIHTVKPEEIFDMQFDVIIGNPPYQLTVGSQKDNYAIPLYDRFVEQAKKLNPRYLTMIIPARWYVGGRGLEQFRDNMLNDSKMRALVDYPNPYDCFNGVDNPGGICYFLWERDYNGVCEFTSCNGDEKKSVVRKLNEYPIFIRDVIGLEFIKKIQSLNINNGETLDKVVSPQNPFGIVTSYKPLEEGLPCWFTQRIGLKFINKKDYRDENNYLNKYKLLIPKAPIAGQTDFTKPVGLYYDGNTIIANPGECCSQTWLVANSFDSFEEAKSFKSYLLTKTVRFLILQTVVSQDVGRNRFCFVPALNKYEGIYTDEKLKEMWGITDSEWDYINAKIHNYGGNE